MNVDEFMARLTANATPSGRVQRFQDAKRTLEKVYLNFPDNFGSYQLFPVGSKANNDYPFVTLSGTREVCVPKKRVTQDGKEENYTMWIKILPKSAYVMKDLTGRTTSSLTAEDETLLDSAISLWDQIKAEVDHGMVTEEQKAQAWNIMRNLIRKRNYTIFNAYCLNRWEMNSTKAPVRSNFSGLFVSTASGFSANLKSDVDQKALMYGGSNDFLQDIYSMEKTGRTGSLFLTINRPAGQTVYNINFNHVPNTPNLASIAIPDADYELMGDPLETFLGSQARRDQENVPVGERRLFNATIIRDAISFMTRQLASIRMAKQGNMDIQAAIDATNSAALAEAVTRTATVSTNDPMLAATANTGVTGTQVNVEKIIETNTNPMQTPPAARMNPITGEPVGATNPTAPASGAPFSQPGFAAPSPFGGFPAANGTAEDDMPF